MSTDNNPNDILLNWMKQLSGTNTESDIFTQLFSALNIKPPIDQSPQQYWDTWSEAMKTSNPMFNNQSWPNMLDQWFKAIPTQPQDLGGNLLNQIIEMGKSFMDMSEQTLNVQKDGSNTAEAWSKMLEKNYQDWLAALQQGHAHTANNPFNTEPLQSFIQQLNAMQPDWQEGFKNMLNNQDLGYSQQQQEQMQKMAAMMMDYHTAYTTYQDNFTKMGADAVESFKAQLKDIASSHDQAANIKSIQDLFAMWVKVSEETYQQFTMTDHYQSLYAEMVNAMTALKQALTEAMDSGLQQTNIASRSELDKAFERIQSVKRKNHALKKKVSKCEKGLKKLKKRIKALEEGDGKATPKAKPAAKPKTSATKKAPTKSTAAKPAAKATTTKKAAVKPAAKPATKATAAKPAAAKPAAAKPAAAKPAAAKPAAAKAIDDLTKIKGIGEKVNEALLAEGINTFAQIANLTPKQAEELDNKIGTLGRFFRSDWIEQARKLSL